MHLDSQWYQIQLSSAVWPRKLFSSVRRGATLKLFWKRREQEGVGGTWRREHNKRAYTLKQNRTEWEGREQADAELALNERISKLASITIILHTRPCHSRLGWSKPSSYKLNIFLGLKMDSTKTFTFVILNLTPLKSSENILQCWCSGSSPNELPDSLFM